MGRMSGVFSEPAAVPTVESIAAFDVDFPYCQRRDTMTDRNVNSLFNGKTDTNVMSDCDTVMATAIPATKNITDCVTVDSVNLSVGSSALRHPDRAGSSTRTERHRRNLPSLIEGRWMLLAALCWCCVVPASSLPDGRSDGRGQDTFSWLLSAQCQAQCLDTFRSQGDHQRTEATLQQQIRGRHQRHQLEESGDNLSVDAGVEEFVKCENDDECLSCLQPCWNETFHFERCVGLCDKSRVAEACANSCAFLDSSSRALRPEVTSEQLSAAQRCSSSETTTSAEPEVDSEDQEVDSEDQEVDSEDQEVVSDSPDGLDKDRKCVKIESRRSDCVDFLSLNAREVWETRGAVLSWQVKPHPHRPPATLPVTHPVRHQRHRPHRGVATPVVLYVVQMRQVIGRGRTTDWSATSATPSTTFYLKHTLTLGMTYAVRVVAVTALGLCAVSSTSAPFGLPKEFPVPGPVRNLRYDDFDRDRGGVLSYTVRWNSPNFTIPIAISNYLVTWEEQVLPSGGRAGGGERVADVVERHLTERGGIFTSMRPVYLQEHVRIPGNRQSYSIQNLKANATYVVQIQAVAHLVEHQIYGETASLKINTLSLSTRGRHLNSSLLATRLDSTNVTVTNVSNVQVQSEFYKNGSLVVVLTWKYKDDTRRGIKGFSIQLHSEHCPTDLFDHSINSYNRSVYLTANNQASSVALSDLLFDCTYWVGVRVVAVQHTDSSRYNEKFITFSTPSCFDVAVIGTSYPDCPRSVPYNFTCDTQFTLKATLVNCRWSYRGEPTAASIRGFLVVVKNPVVGQRHLKNATTTTAKYRLKNKDARQIQLKDLVHNSKYYATVRAVGNEGLGPITQTNFFVPPLPYQGDSHQAAFHATHAANAEAGSGSTESYRIAPLMSIIMLTMIHAFTKF